MDQQTWTTIIAALGVLLTLVGLLLNMKKDLTAQVNKSEAALGTRIDELGTRIGKVAAEGKADNKTTRNELGTRIEPPWVCRRVVSGDSGVTVALD